MGLFNEGLMIEKKHTNEELYEHQMQLLKTFLSHGAISQEQYNISTKDLTEKMGVNTGSKNRMAK